ncbi:hypothetical protein [Mycolicibacterium sp. HS_4_1]
MAIAEKAHTQSREASVRWDHLRAGLYGVSKRTAERAVRDLKSHGLITVVRPGFNNGHGTAAAPIYRIEQITDADTQMSASTSTDADTQMSVSTPTDTDKIATDTDKTGTRYRHPGVVLDVSIDGPIDGEGAPAPSLPTNQVPSRQTARGPYGPRCPKHIHDPNPPDCPGCRDARLAERDARLADEASQKTDRQSIRTAIDLCDDCDEFGLLLHGPPMTACPRHRNFRSIERASA